MIIMNAIFSYQSVSIFTTLSVYMYNEREANLSSVWKISVKNVDFSQDKSSCMWRGYHQVSEHEQYVKDIQ